MNYHQKATEMRTRLAADVTAAAGPYAKSVSRHIELKRSFDAAQEALNAFEKSEEYRTAEQKIGGAKARQNTIEYILKYEPLLSAIEPFRSFWDALKLGEYQKVDAKGATVTVYDYSAVRSFLLGLIGVAGEDSPLSAAVVALVPPSTMRQKHGKLTNTVSGNIYTMVAECRKLLEKGEGTISVAA